MVTEIGKVDRNKIIRSFLHSVKDLEHDSEVI